MDIEQLRMIIEALGGVSEDAKMILLAWICVIALRYLVVAAVVAWSISWVARYIHRCILPFTTLHRIRNIVLPRECGMVVPREIEEIMKVVDAGVKAIKNKAKDA